MSQDKQKGLFVFSSSLQLLYMSQDAATLRDKINQERLGDKTKGLLPQEVMTLCSQLRGHIKANQRGEVIELQGECFVSGPPRHTYLLRGLALADNEGLAHSRILVFIEGHRHIDTSMERVIERFRLTDREHVVLQEISKGFTNKEIGNTLGITEQTVKAHVKRLMQKMETTTRTGLLSCLLEQFRQRG